MRRKSLYAVVAVCLFLLPVTSIAAEDVSVSLWGWKGDKEESFAIEAFEKANPNIKVEYNAVTMANLLVKLKSAFAAGIGPDVMLLEEAFMTMALSRFLEPLEDYAKEEWGPFWETEFWSQPLKFVLESDPEGKHYYQIPGYIQSVEIWANMALFNEAGIGTLPKTYDELVQDAEKLRAVGIIPLVTGPADRWSLMDILLPIFDQTAPDMFPLAERGQISFTEAGFIEGMQVIRDFFFKDKIPQEGVFGMKNYPECRQIFGGGKAAMWPIGSWNMGMFTRHEVFDPNITENFDTFYFPAIKPDGRSSRPIGGVDWGLAMNKNAAHKSEAWKLIASHTSGEAMEAWIRYGYFSPPAYRGIDFMPILEEAMWEKPQQVAKKLIADFPYISMRRHINYPELREAIIDATMEVGLGRKAPAEAMAEIEEVSKQISR